MTGENPYLVRNLTSIVEQCFTRALEREETVEVPDITVAGQPVVRSHMKEVGSWILQTRLATADSDLGTLFPHSNPEDQALHQISNRGSHDGSSLCNSEATITMTESNRTLHEYIT